MLSMVDSSNNCNQEGKVIDWRVQAEQKGFWPTRGKLYVEQDALFHFSFYPAPPFYLWGGGGDDSFRFLSQASGKVWGTSKEQLAQSFMMSS